MIENEGQDVKSTETTEVEPSTTTNTTETTPTSAETKNTEEDVVEGQHVPYSRFKEINEAKKALEEQMKEKDAKYAAYSQLDDTMQKHPELNAKINEVIEAWNNGDLTKKQAEKAIEEITDDASDPTVNNLVFATYNNEYMNLASKDFDDPKMVAKVGDATTFFMEKMYGKNAMSKYVPGRIKAAYKAGKEYLNEFADLKIAKYATSKKEDVQPNTKAGATVTSTKELRTHDDEVNFLAESLKNAK